MMKKYILSFLFALTSCGLMAQGSAFRTSGSLRNINAKFFETMLPDSAVTETNIYGEKISYKSFFSKDNDGNFITEIENHGYDNDYNRIRKITEIFDEKGRLTSYIEERYDDNYHRKEAYVFTTNQTERYYYNSDGGSEKWIPQSKLISTFDDNGYFNTSVYSLYQQSESSYEIFRTDNFAYTVEDDGSVKYSVYIAEDGNEPVLSELSTYKYDAGGNPTYFETKYLDENSSSISSVSMLEYNQFRKVKGFEWTDVYEDCEENRIGTYEYDAKGNILMEDVRHTNSGADGNWYMRTTFYYDTESSIKSIAQSNISTCYDAASQSLLIKGLENKASVSVYFIDGNLLLTKEITGNGSVAMDSYQSGIYIVTVKMAGECVSQKMIKK